VQCDWSYRRFHGACFFHHQDGDILKSYFLFFSPRVFRTSFRRFQVAPL
jgi:hypothetical protein